MNQKRIGIFVPEELRDEIKKIAEKNSRTMVGQLKEWIKQNKQNEKN